MATLSDEQKAWAKDQWSAGGLSASQIAGQLSEPGRPVSRNVVIGVITRAGLQRGPNSQVIRLPRPRLAKAPKPPTARRAAPEALQPDPALVVTMMDVTKEQCRWPVELPEDARFLYCGRGKFRGSQYCEGHTALGLQPKKDPRK